MIFIYLLKFDLDMLLVMLAVSRPWCPGVNVDTSQVTRKTSLVHFTRGDYEIWITKTLTHLPPDWYTGLRYAALFGRDIPCYHADFTHPLSATTSLRAALRLKNVFNSGFIKTTQSRHGKVRVGLDSPLECEGKVKSWTNILFSHYFLG